MYKTAPQTKRQASPGHDRYAPSKRPCHYSISHKSDPADLELQCHESIQSLTNHNPHHKRLTYHQTNKQRNQSCQRQPQSFMQLSRSSHRKISYSSHSKCNTSAASTRDNYRRVSVSSGAVANLRGKTSTSARHAHSP